MDGGVVRSEDDRNDLRIDAGDGKAVLSQFVSQEFAQLNQARSRSVCFRCEVHSGGNLPGEIRRQGGAENKSARAVDQKAAQIFRAAHKSAGRGKRLAARMHGCEDTRAESPASATQPLPRGPRTPMA